MFFLFFLREMLHTKYFISLAFFVISHILFLVISCSSIEFNSCFVSTKSSVDHSSQHANQPTTPEFTKKLNKNYTAFGARKKDEFLCLHRASNLKKLTSFEKNLLLVKKIFFFEAGWKKKNVNVDSGWRKKAETTKRDIRDEFTGGERRWKSWMFGGMTAF